jgi:hypothetical protein
MLTCLALAAAVGAGAMTEIPALTAEIETEARALAADAYATPGLLVRLEDLSEDASRLSNLLRDAGVGQDMACFFQGVASDAQERAAEFRLADTPAELDRALMHLRVLMEDAALMAPLAATAAQTHVAEASVVAP